MEAPDKSPATADSEELKRSFTVFSKGFLVAMLVFISLISFFVLAKMILIDENEAFDREIYSLIEPHTNETTSRIMVIYSWIGGTQFMLPANILLICYCLFIRKNRWQSIKLGAIALSSVCVMHLLKLLFNRPRPLIPLLEPAHGLSFPSGHAMTSITFFGLFIYLTVKYIKNKFLKIFLVILLLSFIVIIGYSRIYLRVHYPSDVLAGYCMGTIWLVLCLWLLKRIETRK
ncbi:undecaprenyl-diphosphatase [Arcticibacter pallidicorallinus]|uniref:Undecaprenyl-diphosphatase n=1 Tax=Arcticibacter pallidicorallinus TaxID=1259464 RepID=A0A2T0U409_9SPHI|nr:phosphatase PAP2 family protein [Arcticibacter pallidicorallinus]PRY52646.1 undecaprenyl-diphosphatase [Arcticibacter pallidicorallinus]